MPPIWGVMGGPDGDLSEGGWMSVPYHVQQIIWYDHFVQTTLKYSYKATP